MAACSTDPGAMQIAAGGSPAAEGPDQPSTSTDPDIAPPPSGPTTGPASPTTVPPSVPSTVAASARPTTQPAKGSQRPEPCPTPPGKYSKNQIDALFPKVQAMVSGSFSTVGPGSNAVRVELLPGREPLAAQLEARFGDAVEIKVGDTSYCGGPGRSPRCPDLPGTDALPPGLSLRLRLPTTSIKPTDDLNGELVIRNDSPTLFEMEPGQPLAADIVRPGTRTVVGRFSGVTAGTGYQLRLRNGEEEKIAVVVGTSRCDGERGSAVPPGQYGVRVGIGENEGPPGYLAPEVPLTISGP